MPRTFEEPGTYMLDTVFLLSQQQWSHPVNDPAKGQLGPRDHLQPARDVYHPPRAQHQLPDAPGHIIGRHAHMLGRDVPAIFLRQGHFPEFGLHRPGPHHADMDARPGQFAVQGGGEVIQEGFGRAVQGNALAGDAA